MAELVTRQDAHGVVSAIADQIDDAKPCMKLDCILDDLYDENAELRRWLGAAAKVLYRHTNGNIDRTWGEVQIFAALSRGEQVPEDVRRMYLGDEE